MTESSLGESIFVFFFARKTELAKNAMKRPDKVNNKLFANWRTESMRAGVSIPENKLFRFGFELAGAESWDAFIGSNAFTKIEAIDRSRLFSNHFVFSKI